MQDSGNVDAYNDLHKSVGHFQWKHRPGRFTILFTTTAHDYNTGMIRYFGVLGRFVAFVWQQVFLLSLRLLHRSVFYDLVDAMLDHPDANVLVWGPGFEGWIDDDTIEQNMRSRFACGEVDIHVNFLGEYGHLAWASQETSAAPAVSYSILCSQVQLISADTMTTSSGFNHALATH